MKPRGKSFLDTVLGLVYTSWQWDFREFRVRSGKGIRDAVVAPVATSVHQSVGSGWIPRLGLGKLVKRTVRLRG